MLTNPPAYSTLPIAAVPPYDPPALPQPGVPVGQARAPRPVLDEWVSASGALFPRGAAWPRDPATVLGRFIGLVAAERKLRYERALVLLDVESVPDTTTELLPEWERSAGLPDPCVAAPGSLAARRAALLDRLFGNHDPTRENMIAWARAAGWNITIREQQDFVAGISHAGETIGESDFTWVVTVLDQEISFFHAGANASGDPLWDFPDLSSLECVLRRANPAHLQLYFIVP